MLPTRSTLIGRDDELAALTALVERARLVTVTGGAGFGKTRLVKELLSRRSRQGLFCDLSTVVDEEGLAGAIASTLGITLRANEAQDARVARIGAWLEDQPRPLLVLDNFEHLGRRSAEVVADLVDRAPSAHFVVTSRQRLALVDETLLGLGPLSLVSDTGSVMDAEAVALLVARVQSLSPERRFGEEDTATLLAIATALDANPLALELVAARLVLLSPTDVLERLTDRFALLRSRELDRPSRHRGLSQAIAWSWALLDEAERSCLVSGALFKGPFSVEAAEAIVDRSSPGDTTALDQIHQLVDKSLLQVEHAGEGRPPQLRIYLSVQDYALGAYASRPELESARRRYRAYFAQSCAEWSVPMLASQRANLLQALEMCLEDPALDAAEVVPLSGALSTLALARGPIGPHLRLLDRAVGLMSEAEHGPELVFHICLSRGRARHELGDSGARDDWLRALSAAKSGGRLAHEAEACRFLGLAASRRGELEEADGYLDEALALARAAGERRIAGEVLSSRALVLQQRGELEASIACCLEQLPIHIETKNRRFEALARSLLAGVHMELGDTEAALSEWRRSIAVVRGHDERRLEAVATAGLALTLHASGALDEAIPKYEEAQALLRELGESWYLLQYSGYFAAAQLEAGELGVAARLLASARESRVWDPSFEALLVGVSVMLLLEEGRLEEADEALTKAEGAAEDERALTILRAFRGATEMVGASRLRNAGRAADADAKSRSAFDRLRALSITSPDRKAPIERSVDARLAVRLLTAALGAPPERESEGALCLLCERRSIELPSGETVDLHRRRVAWQLLMALAVQRLSAPGAPLGQEALTRAVWPKEQMTAASARNRVHVAINGLRRVGLGEMLRSQDGGYLLDPEITVEIEAGGDSGDA